MRVLVVAASKHGSTAEIATALGKALADRGITATVADAEDVADIEECDAVVLGSADLCRAVAEGGPGDWPRRTAPSSPRGRYGCSPAGRWATR